MRIRARTAGIATGAVVIGVVAACGGGYGGGGNMNPPPTVTFSTPAQAMSINLGQAVKLAWTSSSATSCMASTSSATGGTFTGSQSASGQMSVVPTATGSVSYTLSCSGAGGTTKASSPMVTVNPSILSQLASATAVKIASTVDAVTGDDNPYGLA